VRLRDKVAIVTGTSPNIGGGIAETLASEGAHLACIDADLANANEIAGTIVTRTLAIINVAGFIFGLVALLITFAFRRAMKGFALALQVLSLIVLVGTTAVGHSIVAARMRALRVAMVTIDLVPPDDPRRVAFAQLHVYSVALLTAAMIASAIAIVAILFSRRSVGR